MRTYYIPGYVLAVIQISQHLYETLLKKTIAMEPREVNKLFVVKLRLDLRLL